jgi:flagellar hook-associated protein 1 FlgK
MSNISLYVAATGIDAAQTAMDTIAQNLSNANTPGYISETAQLVSFPGSGVLDVGGGVRVAGISQAGDQLLMTSAQQAAAALSQSSALQQVLNQAQLTFQEPSANGLENDLNNFWQSWDSIASNPSDQAGRMQVIDNAQTLASDLHQAQQQLATTTSNAATQLSGTVQSAGQLLSEVAQLNGQIVSAKAAGGSAASLVDQRNAVMDQLSAAIGATGTTQSDGSVQVNLGGVTLVQGSWSDHLTLQDSSGTYSVVAGTSGVALTTTSGTAAGLMASLNSYLPTYQSQLDSVADHLSSLVNGQLAAGYTAAGTPGQPLFTGSGAGGITVNAAIVADPTQIAASATSTLPDATNDGGNAQAMAELAGAPNGPDALYRTLVLNVGNQVSGVQNQVQAQTAVSNAAQQNLEAVTGVNPNDQLVSLLGFQQSYQAAAKVISTVDLAVQSLIQAV